MLLSLFLCFRLLSDLSFLEDAIQGTGGKIVARMTCNRDAACLCRVLVLAMTALCGYQIPAITFDQLDDIADFHGRGMEEVVSLPDSVEGGLCSGPRVGVRRGIQRLLGVAPRRGFVALAQICIG